MINLFRKQPAELKPIPAPVQNTYPEAVQQIHREFLTASDRLISDANEIISQAASKDVSKVNRLESLGFKQAGQVTELKPLIQKAELSKEQVELVRYYRQHYPFNKFITEDQVKAICFRWNLVCGEVGKFKGFVPEKNLREIEAFKLKSDDDSICFKDKYTGKLFFLSKDDFTEYGSRYCFETNEFFIVGNNGENIYGSHPLLKPSVLERYSNERSLLVVKADTTLQICAPIKDMDMSGMTLTDGYKMEKIHVPDPVVLQPVKGGYLLITCWGDEASDPNCVNEINN